LIKMFSFKIWRLYFNFHVRRLFSRFKLGIELNWFNDAFFGKRIYSLDLDIWLGILVLGFNVNFARGRADA